MMNSTLKLLTLTICLSVSSNGQENYIGFPYGEDHAYKIQAPVGWILDNQSGVEQGLHAVFYPVDSTWENSDVVMYTNVVIKKYRDYTTFQDFTEERLSAYRNRYDGNTAALLDSFPFPNGYWAPIYKYYDNQSGLHEQVCYIDEGKTIVLFVIQARNRELFSQSYQSFYDLIYSYEFLTDSKDEFLEKFKEYQSSGSEK